MMLYNLLYYKCHTRGAKTGRYWGGSALGAFGPVMCCLLLNAVALSLVLERLLQVEWALAEHPVAIFAIGGCICGGTIWYYNRNSRRIIDRYEDSGWGNLPLGLVVVAYYSLSFGVALLSGIYRNHGWVFKGHQYPPFYETERVDAEYGRPGGRWCVV